MYDENGRNIGGRPTKCTPELTKKFCDALRLGCPLVYALQYVELNEATYYDWMERGENQEEPFLTFSKEVNQTEPDFILTNLDIIKKASQKEWPAGAWLLERKAAKFFARNQTRVKLKTPDQKLSIADRILDLTNQILDQVASGQMSVEDAKAATAALEAQRKVTETVEITEKVRQIDETVKAAITK